MAALYSDWPCRTRCTTCWIQQGSDPSPSRSAMKAMIPCSCHLYLALCSGTKEWVYFLSAMSLICGLQMTCRLICQISTTCSSGCCRSPAELRKNIFFSHAHSCFCALTGGPGQSVERALVGSLTSGGYRKPQKLWLEGETWTGSLVCVDTPPVLLPGGCAVVWFKLVCVLPGTVSSLGCKA